MAQTTPHAPSPAGAADIENACPRCGAPTAPLQEYCLDCGLRLPDEAGVRPAAELAVIPTARAGWLWPVLVALVVALVSAAAVIALRTRDGGPSTQVIATTAIPDFVPASPGAEPVTQSVPTLPLEPPPEPAPRRSARRRPGELTEWPRGKDGWTVVLASLPAARGRAIATARAKEAVEAGVADVGVLDSSRYSSLHPGYYVVFSGVYDSLEAANDALAEIEQGGREGYVTDITS